MPDPTEAHKGIKCQGCGAVDKFKTGQMKRSQDCLKRPKLCKVCGATTTTVEVPIGCDAVKEAPVTVAVAGIPVPVEPVEPVVDVVPPAVVPAAIPTTTPLSLLSTSEQ